MSTVIKTDGSHGPAYGSRAAVFNFEDIGQQARQYLRQVQTQAARILAEAKEQAERMRQQAKEEGKAQAIQVAEANVEQQVQQRLESVLPALQAAVAGMHGARGEYLRQWEGRVIHLAVAIAERILRRPMTDPLEVAPTLIRETLELAAGRDKVRLHLNPVDHEALQHQMHSLLRETSMSTSPEIVADPAVSRGGCIVKTEFGEIDQRFETQLARIEEELSPSG